MRENYLGVQSQESEDSPGKFAQVKTTKAHAHGFPDRQMESVASTETRTITEDLVASMYLQRRGTERPQHRLEPRNRLGHFDPGLCRRAQLRLLGPISPQLESGLLIQGCGAHSSLRARANCWLDELPGIEIAERRFRHRYPAAHANPMGTSK